MFMSGFKKIRTLFLFGLIIKYLCCDIVELEFDYHIYCDKNYINLVLHVDVAVS